MADVKSLSLDERETHLSLPASDRSTWSIYTDDPVMMKRLDRIKATLTHEHVGGGRSYTLPNKQVTLRKLRKLTEAQRKEIAERLHG